MSAVDVTNQGGTMSENLRDKIARAMYSWDVEDGSLGALGWGDLAAGQRKVWLSGADAVLAVVSPELDRLRAEVEDGRRQVHTYHDRAMASEVAEAMAEAERDDLRARLAKVEALHGGLHWCFGPNGADVYEQDTKWWPCPTLAVLASVPEPSDSQPVANPRGDDRETASEPAPDVQSWGVDPHCLCTYMDGKRYFAIGCRAHDEPAPDADREVCDDPMCGSGKHRHYGDRIEWDADREAGERA